MTGKTAGAPRAKPAKMDRRTVLALLGAASTGSLVGPGLALGAPPAPGESGADGASASRDLGHLFLRAVREGDLPAVLAMLDADATLASEKDDSGRSAYILARLGGHRDVASALFERGIELDIAEAVLAGDWDRVDELAADNPAIMNEAHPIGGNPLYASAIGGGVRMFHIRKLGADSNGRPEGGSGFTPARAAMNCADPLDAWLGAIDVLSNGGDVNAPQAGGDTVLHGAVRARDQRLVRLAMRKGADLSARDIAGRTATDLAGGLAWAAGAELLSRHAEVPRDNRGSRLAFTADRVPFSLQNIDDVPRDLQGETTSMSHFNVPRVRELLAREPRLIHSFSTDAELAIEACGHTGQRDIIRMHLELGAPLSLPTAISLGDLEHARWLLERDPTLIHERGPHDFPLMWYPAIGGDSVEALELLLEFGADIEQDSAGETLLHRAAARNRSALVHRLLQQGGDTTAVGYRQFRDGRTPHSVAVARKSEDVLAVFREFGIDA